MESKVPKAELAVMVARLDALKRRILAYQGRETISKQQRRRLSQACHRLERASKELRDTVHAEWYAADCAEKIKRMTKNSC